MGITVSPAALKARTALFPNLCRLRDAPITATTRPTTSLYRADLTTTRADRRSVTMPSGATATPDPACPGRVDLHHRARAAGDYRRRRGLLRRGLARDAGLERLADTALQLHGSVAEAGPLLLDDGRSLYRGGGDGGGRPLRGGDGGTGPDADHLVGRAAPSRFGGGRLAGRGDRGHLLRLFHDGTLGVARLTPGPVHYRDDRRRPARD